jgi:hypothetical protein
MANEKRPSIYQDRGTIGSTKELDEYGVWVKSGPQDLAGSDSGAGEENFSLDGLDDLSDFPADFDSSSEGDSDSADSGFSLSDDDFSIENEDAAAFSLDPEDQSAGDSADFSLEEDASGFSLSEDDMSLPEEISAEEAPEDNAPESPAPEDAAFSLDLEDQSAGDSADFSLEEDVSGFSLSEDDISLPEEISAEEAPEDNAPESPAPEEDAEGFDEMPLEDLLGDVADEVPGLDMPEEDRALGSSDKSTQLLMKIAEELSSIRVELSALKQEFSNARTVAREQTESRGFFNDAGGDDKIALTGDELDNILNTAEFTEEAGVNAEEEEQLPDFSEGDTPEVPADISPETEISPDELTLEAEPAGGAEEPLEVGNLPELDELDTEILDDTDLSLVDLSDSGIAEDFSIEEGAGGEDIEEPSAEDLEILTEEDLPEENLLEESLATEEPADSEEPDVSFDLSFSEEERIALENLDEDVLDLTGAVIEEPDLEMEIQENPVLEPALSEFTLLEEDGLGENNEDLLPEIEILQESSESPAVEILDDAGFSPIEESEESIIEEVEDEAEISRTEESAAEIPAAGEGGSQGEDLDQIIPEGFLVEELDDEGEAGFGGAGLDILEEEISLDEIPEDVLPEEDEGAGEAAGAADSDEPEVSALPGNFKTELKQVLSYMDQLLESLPEEKIEEFAKSEYFDTYKKLFKELGLA